MATIFQRVSLIIKSNVNELLDRFEDPEKIIDQCLSDAKEEYAVMLKDTATVKGNLKIAKNKLQNIEKDCNQWQSVAEKAVKAGNDGDARKALQNLEECKQQKTSQESVVSKCEDATNKAVASLNSFADQIRAMEMKKDELKSKAIAAKSQQKANALKSKSIAGSLSKFNEMAEKIDSNLAAQEAMAELTGANEKEDEDLLAKYSSPDVDDALVELKKKMGMI
ncbi:PspA/IM30 family protein [Enterocloster aldenensis]|uniref:PspA/IM30 family protein n=1 Tax=Enterocloster aldenensis TaxID=358742 RepID=UPI000E4C1DE7|nr:PspA/IM30 family protein [Enterocloster aldenensis]